MATMWREAPDYVLDIARQVIAAHHPRLAEIRIGFLMRSEAPTNMGKQVFAKVKKVSDQDRVYIPFDVVIWIAADTWGYLNASQREALIDHELCHCEYDGLRVSLKGHDLEEFACIVERHGLWLPDVRRFAEAVRAHEEQMPMDFGEEHKPPKREGGVGKVDVDGLGDDELGQRGRDLLKKMREVGEVEVQFMPAGMLQGRSEYEAGG